MKNLFRILIALIFIINVNNISAQSKKKDTLESIYNGLKFRSIGPAFMSGRISDITLHPDNENIWYVTVGSGGVWKTLNAGTTWESIFDNQKSYATGCVTLDPQNPSIVWVGSGENNGGRHISYGDGVYRSGDDGKTWRNMGLEKSEHISKIVVHPENSNIVWVACQGPLWSKGGERGIYKTLDGGKTWNRTLGDDKWVGATDILIDPRDPNLLYAATWQRHRTVAGYMGGGPGTAIFKSEDGGENWVKLNVGLPKSNMGKIGLAISPQKPDVIYAAIELDRRKGGLFRSENRGASWVKMSDAVAGGTGPHYYQELFASPHEFDKIYFADNYMQVSNDGGKTFVRMNENEKHVDNHAVAFRKNDPNYILVGCDGGLYESYDKTKNWRFINNLPITQFYKIAVDDAKPFYYIYGGTQDNNTQGGISRTDNIHGIRNSDWFVVLGGDGHQPATEPGNPNIVYAQWQQGNLTRHDRTTGENVYIQPQPDLGEKTERFNWDSPVVVSSHKPSRLYFASQRVWKSENRGDTWSPISGDLTKNIERVSTPFFDEQQKWDNPWDIYAMSNYSTITSLSESPIKEGLIYAGTDDGLIQVTDDGGANWIKIDYNKIDGLPKTAFVNDIKADLFDENIVYAVFDNHKYGDYQPYLYKSFNKGKSWEKLNSNLPERTLLWRIVQDYEQKDLMFLGTEFGVYFTIDGGESWSKLKGGIPNISVRDLAIQKRENDLVLGTFGRGIYILDDYSALREINRSNLKKEAILFKPRKALWYQQKRILGGGKKASQGDNYYVADNPPFGVELTYYLKENYASKSEERKKNEEKLIKDNVAVGVPDWNTLEQESREISPSIWVFIFNDSGEIIRKIKAKNKKGINRIAWDLNTESSFMITPDNLKSDRSGTMVAPGEYSAKLYKQLNGKFMLISDEVRIEVEPLYEGYLKGSSKESVAAFWSDLHHLSADTRSLTFQVNKAKDEINVFLKAYERSKITNDILEKNILNSREELLLLNQKLNGSEARSEIGEKNEYPTIWNYIGAASSGTNNSTYGPTPSHKKSFENAQTLFKQMDSELKLIVNSFTDYRTQLKELGAPIIKD